MRDACLASPDHLSAARKSGTHIRPCNRNRNRSHLPPRIHADSIRLK
jgi:hypothetical protein